MKHFFSLLYIVFGFVAFGQLNPTQLTDLQPTAISFESPILPVALERETKGDGPFIFGEPVNVKLGKDAFEKYTIGSDGRHILSFHIKNSDAKSLNLLLENLSLEVGEEILVYNPQQPEFALNYTQRNISKNKTLTTLPISGNELMLVLALNDKRKGVFDIGHVVYGYKSTGAFGESGSCNINANCPDANAYRDQQKAVALILNAAGNGHCTGTLVNNSANDGTPYIISAGHCIPANRNNLENWTFAFGFESPNCTNQNATPISFTGAELKVYDTYYDAALLLMDERPQDNGADVYYAGWDLNAAAPSSARVFHHPSGDIKKFSVDNGGIVKDHYLGNVNDFKAWKVIWDKGTTEGGSSGSALLNQNGHIVGTLTGGKASCSATNEADYYAAINDYFTYCPNDSMDSYAPWLDPALSRISSLNGWDPDEPRLTYDLSIAGIKNLPKEICNQDLTPSVAVYNAGANAVNSFSIVVKNGVSELSRVDINEALASNVKKEYALPKFSLAQSASLSIVIEFAQTDLNPSNNEAELDLVVNTGIPYVLEVRLDNWGSENTWEIVEKNSNTQVASGGPYANQSDGTIIFHQFCLTEGECYTLKFTDSEGDGMCCDYGDGYYRLTGPGNVDIDGWRTPPKSNPGAITETADFCATTSGITGLAGVETLSVFPNPVKAGEVVNFKGITGDAELSMYNVLGQLITRARINNADFRVPADLAAGTYRIILTQESKAFAASILVE